MRSRNRSAHKSGDDNIYTGTPESVDHRDGLDLFESGCEGNDHSGHFAANPSVSVQSRLLSPKRLQSLLHRAGIVVIGIEFKVAIEIRDGLTPSLQLGGK